MMTITIICSFAEEVGISTAFGYEKRRRQHLLEIPEESRSQGSFEMRWEILKGSEDIEPTIRYGKFY